MQFYCYIGYIYSPSEIEKMMTMDRSGSSRKSTSSTVVAIDVLEGSSRAADQWGGGGGKGGAVALQTGDIVEEVTFGGAEPPASSPFKGGKSGVMKLLHAAFKRGEISVLVRARRGRAGDPATILLDFHAHVVLNPAAGRRQYLLRSVGDPNHAVRLVDRSESDCIAFQDSRSSRVVWALNNAQLQNGYVSYPWEKKMKETLLTPNSSCFLSVLILPKASSPTSDAPTRYSSIEDTLARAHAWLNSSQASGIPIVFMHIQTEALLTKISGETASATVSMVPVLSTHDLSKLANASLYGFEDYHGVDIGVVRAVRLWYAPAESEMAVEIKPREGDTKLGFSISRTEEGFIYISSVEGGDDGGRATSTASAARTGLRKLYKEASSASKKLVVSRVGNEKVLPWMVSASGDIRCFDTVSLSQKLSLHRHALKPILLYLLMWDQTVPSETTPEIDPITPMSPPFIVPRWSSSDGAAATSPSPPSPMDDVFQDFIDKGVVSEAGDLSFRFCDFSDGER
ncbi:hypothetical protein Cni_G01636 [Canna indica]|uniref:Uncharacterized protein n=1 Tax=Canna indica TaxID=4628 RepID=A0AAQ3JMU7_9LILI|nr:hypothetical protein Cni_G01636 [Canna indica]